MTKIPEVILGILSTVGFGGFLGYLLVPSFQGTISTLIWDGKSTLMCSGSDEMTLTDRQITLKSGPIVSAGGNCRITLIRCDLKAPSGISGGGNAKIILNGGSIVSSGTAIFVGGSAVVTVDGTSINGRIQRAGGARIEGLSKDRIEGYGNGLLGRRAADLDPKVAKAARQSCQGVLACYQAEKAYGQISGLLTSTINAKGVAIAAKLERGEPPAAVRKCLLKIAKQRKVKGGGPGKLSCEYGGTYLESGQMLSMDPRFEPSR